MGALLALCEGGQTFSLLDLKLRLEGQRKQAKTDPGTEPDVYVNLLQVRWAEGQRFSPLKFALRGVRFEVEVEIHGGAEGATSRASSGLFGKMSDRMKKTPSLRKAPEALRKKTLRVPVVGKTLSSRTVHNVKAELALDLLKELGDDAVEATVRSFRLDRAVPGDVLTPEALERHVAQAISTKVGEMASRMAKESSDRLARCGQDKASKMRDRYDKHGTGKDAKWSLEEVEALREFEGRVLKRCVRHAADVPSGFTTYAYLYAPDIQKMVITEEDA